MCQAELTADVFIVVRPASEGMYVRMYVCMYVRVYVCMYVCTCVYMYVLRMCLCIYSYICTRRVQKKTELFKLRANQHRGRAAATERT